LSVPYRIGRIIIETGIEWIRKAARKNYPDALGMLAEFHERGQLSFPKYLEKAFKFRKRAADTGDGLALFNLGVAYLQGKGVAENQNTGIRFFECAAAENIQNAMFLLGMINTKLKNDPIRGYMWIELASNWKLSEWVTEGIPGMTEKANAMKITLGSSLTEKQLKMAQKLAHECVRKKYIGC
jgi:TPR repeat protein